MLGEMKHEVLKVEELRVRGTGNAEILRGMNLTLRTGERVAILGSSGAGKTTLFRAIVGLMPASSGRVLLNGVEISKLRGRRLREQRRHIGFVAQKHDLVEPLLVRQNVMAGALGRWSTAHALRYLLRPTPDERRCAEEALHAVGLAHLSDVGTAQLSGGEQQRVAIARALVQQPILLLADEPVASLDPAKCHEVLRLLIQVAVDRNMALICTLHQPDLARQYFERIVEVREGRTYEGTPARDASSRAASGEFAICPR